MLPQLVIRTEGLFVRAIRVLPQLVGFLPVERAGDSYRRLGCKSNDSYRRLYVRVMNLRERSLLVAIKMLPQLVTCTEGSSVGEIRMLSQLVGFFWSSVHV
jgi:hypothetical protein